jgi:hypothetical protein
VFSHVFPHELPKHLHGRRVLAKTGFEELVAQSFLNTDVNPGVFDSHFGSV